jgi:hypothetical protein
MAVGDSPPKRIAKKRRQAAQRRRWLSPLRGSLKLN